ncbi:MAG: putative Transposable element Tc3 transposase, partial [Streblomastix strix]
WFEALRCHWRRKSKSLNQVKKRSYLSQRSLKSKEYLTKRVDKCYFIKIISMNKKKRDPKPKVTVRGQRRISRYVEKHRKVSHRTLTKVLSLNCSPSTTLRTLHIMKMKKKRPRRRPKLMERYIAKRIQFAEEFLLNDQSKKTEIIFSDEKKFRFDGPDGWAYYWNSLDEKDEDSTYSKDYRKYKGVMVHATISSAGIFSLDRLQGCITEDVWRELLLSKVLPSIHAAHGEQFKYQMDNASCHKNKETLKDLESYGFSFLDWPALSPDLNPVENM